MAIKTFTTGEVLTAADTNTYLANSGLVYVKSQTVGSGVTSVTVSDAFSATYDNYRITVTNSSGSSIDLLKITLTGRTGNTYNYANPYSSYVSGGVSVHYNSNVANGVVALTDTKWNTFIEIQAPFLSQTCTMTFTESCSNYYYQGATFNSSTSSSTGFTLTPTSGTITGGIITVYGYRKG